MDGLRCVGVPVGSPVFVNKYIESKSQNILADFTQINKVITDGLVHRQLLQFCQNTQLGYLSRNVAPDIMRCAAPGTQKVDSLLAKVHLRKGLQG